MTEGWSPRLFQCPLHALRPRRPCCFGIDVGQTSRIDETTYRMGGIDVRVASLNPVKLRAVRDAFAESFPNEAVDVCAIDPSAPLPDQPIEGDIARGAIARRGGRRGLGRRDRGAALPAAIAGRPFGSVRSPIEPDECSWDSVPDSNCPATSARRSFPGCRFGTHSANSDPRTAPTALARFTSCPPAGSIATRSPSPPCAWHSRQLGTADVGRCRRRDPTRHPGRKAGQGGSRERTNACGLGNRHPAEPGDRAVDWARAKTLHGWGLHGRDSGCGASAQGRRQRANASFACGVRR